MTRILIVTDAWLPQINGVVRSLEFLTEKLEELGVEVDFLTPLEFRTLPCPTYPEIRLSLTHQRAVRRRVERSRADCVHLATEGPLGLLARRVTLASGMGYTTSYHTRFPEYLSARFPVPERWTYRWLRRFHNGGLGCMIATESLRADLARRGFRNLMLWSRGVDTELFRPRPSVLDLPRPIFLYVGRVSVEKNLEAFLELDLPGTKMVVGGGPQREPLQRRFPRAVFTGPKVGRELGDIYASSDVFVFPSLTDTFGNVLLEAMASGLPVAAFPVTGPLDVVADSGAGILSQDLRAAALAALGISRARARAHAMNFTWETSARQFLANALAARRLPAIAA